MAVGGQITYCKLLPELAALRTAQDGAEATFSKLPHRVCPETSLSYRDPEANSHHHHSKEKQRDISPRHTSQAVLLPASLPAQASAHCSVLQHTRVPLCLAQHNKHPAMAAPVPPPKLVCPAMRHGMDFLLAVEQTPSKSLLLIIAEESLCLCRNSPSL